MRYFIIIAVVLFVKNVQAYKAAVVEYFPFTENEPKTRILRNLNEYRTFIESARDQDVDIVVFPEYGLTALVEDPKEYAIEMANETEVLKKLRDLAAENRIYLVVNLLEKFNEEAKKTKYYNTNLVFDRNGQIIVQYRKINLFNEPNLTPGNETVTFTTDFGVTFGIFTCFDILYHGPSQTILSDDVTDVIFPTAWYSTMPFYTSLSVQHGYSLANGVNLLAANYGKPKEGHGGSGIFLASGEIAESYIDSSPSSKLIVRDVRRISRRENKETCTKTVAFKFPGGLWKSNISDYKTFKDFKASDFNTYKIDLSKEKVSKEICHGDFCCTFNITIDQPSNTKEIYKLVAYDGLVLYDKKDAHIRVCSLLACEDDSDDSCGARINGTTTFSSIDVSGDLQNDNTTFYRPVTLTYNLESMAKTTFCNEETENKTHVQLSTLERQEHVLVFGIFGRTNGGSLIHGSAVLAILFTVAAKYI